jgi:hypothetical protein
MNINKILDIILLSEQKQLKLFPPDPIIVYHGSDESDIEELEYNYPNYDGGIGGGVYVTRNIDVAKFYGRYVYKCHLNLDPVDIFEISPEMDGMEDHSDKFHNTILIGESLYPFSFYIDNRNNGKTEKYFVGMGSGDVDEETYMSSYINNLILNKIKTTNLIINGNDTGISLADFYDIELLESKIDDGVYLSEFSTDQLDHEYDEKYAEMAEEMLDDIISQVIQENPIESVYGIPIALDDVGGVVMEAGYDAVELDGIRGGHPDNEILVFDSSKIEIIEIM